MDMDTTTLRKRAMGLLVCLWFFCLSMGPPINFAHDKALIRIDIHD